MIINWFDVLVIIFLVWGFISGNKSDFVTEVLKLFGAFVTTFLAVHYFHRFGSLMGKFLWIPELYRDGFGLFVLILMIYSSFFFMAKGWATMLKLKYPLFLDKWGSICVALLKTYVLCGLVYLVCVTTLQGPFARGAKDSLTFPNLSLVSGRIYETTFVGLIRPVFRSEEFNKHLFQYVSKERFNISQY